MSVEQILADHLGSMVKWIGIIWSFIGGLCFVVNFLLKDTEGNIKGLKKVRIDGK